MDKPQGEGKERQAMKPRNEWCLERSCITKVGEK